VETVVVVGSFATGALSALTGRDCVCATVITLLRTTGALARHPHMFTKGGEK
jgi:hypothetical protein